MGSWSDNARRYKLERKRNDPVPDRHKRKRIGQRENPSRKTLLDRLAARRHAYLRAMEWRERAKLGGWKSILNSTEWWRKRYVAALDACHKAGIDIKA